MARRIPWDEQEALLLFDAYEKVQKYPEKKSALINALSINLRRRAADNNVSADDTFRNYAGISMRLSEVEKILHPDKSGLVKTSELFRTTAELYCDHRRTFLKKVQEVEEYRAKVLSDTVVFDLYESVVLLDACLNISAPGETKAHIARLTSAKLRALAINRGCVINEAFRSDGGIAGRLRKMEEAFQSIRTDSDDVPQIFIEAVNLFYNHRNEYKRILKYANSLIGKIILPEDVAKIEKAKQQIRDAAPVEKTLYVKTKKDRKLKEKYSKEFVAVYKMLERRCYVDLSGVTATDLFVDLKKKYQRKVIIEILDGASWAKEIRAGKYVHALGASMMAIQESNERKFFAWVKPKLTLALYQEMQKSKGGISLLFMQKKIIKKPLFLVDDAEEVAAIVNRASSCFASNKTKNLAVQLVTLYATYLKEKMSEKPQVEEEMSLPTPSANANEKQYVLHVGNETFVGETPALAFIYFCEELAVTYPLKIRSLIGIRISGRTNIPLKKENSGTDIKMPTINAYIEKDLLANDAVDYAYWICNMCDKKLITITMSDEATISAVTQENISDEYEKNKVVPAESTESANTSQTGGTPISEQIIGAQQPKKKDNPLLPKMEQIVLRADMDGMSYDDLKDTLQITMVLTKQLIAQSTKIVDIKGVLIHEEAFIDWEDGADELEAIIEKLMLKNNGYISSTQLFEYARIEMNMFLNDNDIREERAVYDIAQHLFEKEHYHGKSYAFRGKTHISRSDAGIGSNMDVYKKYATDQGGVFSFNGLVEYLESIGVSIGNLRNQMKMWTEPTFFFYDDDTVAMAEALRIDDEWKKSITQSLKVLFDDAGNHIILRNIPSIWFDRLPAISGNRSWTPLLLQSVLRFYGKELGARTIQALEGQALETVHTMLVVNDSPIQNFGDVVISYLLEQNIERRKFEAEELRLLLVNGGILHGNELIWNMPKALKSDGRFAWDASGNQVTVKI